MKEYKKIYRRYALVLLGVLLALMVVGSFLDLTISRALYPGYESSLGQFFAAFGEQPAFLGISCAGALLLVRRGRISRGLSTMLGFCGGALVLFGIVMNVHEATDNVAQLPLWAALLVTLFTTLVCSALLVLFTRQTPTKTVLRFVLTVAFVAIATALLINIIKIPWGRARMRLLVQTGNESYFSAWWQAGGTLKRQLVAQGVSSDEFRSFPSGHTACAACAMLMALLPTLNPRLRGKTLRCFLPGCAWTLLVAFSRLRMGAHYLTDVTMATLIFLGVAALGVWLFYFNRHVFRWIWNFLAVQEDPLRNLTQGNTEE